MNPQLYVITTTTHHSHLFGLQACTAHTVLSAISASWIILTAVTCRVLPLTNIRHYALIRHEKPGRDYEHPRVTHSASLTHHQIRWYEQAISKWTCASYHYEVILACSTKPGHRQKRCSGPHKGTRYESVTAFGNTHATGRLPVVGIWYRRYPPLKQAMVNLGMEQCKTLVLLVRYELGACVGYENDRVVN